MWCYNSSVGIMKIYLSSNQRYILEICDEIYGSYHSPQAAADDVYNHATGCYEWDSLDCCVPDVPSGLSEWESYS